MADSGLEWIRKVRHEMSAEFGHDPRRMVDYFIREQEEFKDRLVRLPKTDQDTKATD